MDGGEAVSGRYSFSASALAFVKLVSALVFKLLRAVYYNRNQSLAPVLLHCVVAHLLWWHLRLKRHSRDLRTRRCDYLLLASVGPCSRGRFLHWDGTHLAPPPVFLLIDLHVQGDFRVLKEYKFASLDGRFHMSN